jgi:uncharacterized protein YndB with AHSA1/START domain
VVGTRHKLVIEPMEVERGGHWRFIEHGPDGVHGFEGRYREVVPPARVVQTFEWDGMPGYVCIETVTLEDLGDGRTKSREHVAVSHERGARRHAGVGHGARTQRELCRPRPIAGASRLTQAQTAHESVDFDAVER